MQFLSPQLSEYPQKVTGDSEKETEIETHGEKMGRETESMCVEAGCLRTVGSER